MEKKQLAEKLKAKQFDQLFDTLPNKDGYIVFYYLIEFLN